MNTFTGTNRSSKLFCLTILLFLCSPFSGFSKTQSQPVFSDYFEDRTMRVDYVHLADDIREYVEIRHIFKQGPWAGNPKNLINPFDNGIYYIKVYQQMTGKLIFSQGFNSYCAGYMTTDKAAKGISRDFLESALIPFPKKKIRFTLERRDKKNGLTLLFSQIIDPTDMEVLKKPLLKGVTVIKAVKNGPPHKKVDVAFIAEGYTKAEKKKFKKDLKEMTKIFFNMEPFKSRKKDFNVYGVFKASKESGSDEPTRKILKDTAVGSSFNALNLYRYNLTEDTKALQDVAAHVPYDTIVIMVNHKRYGGGGMYNTYCLFTMNDKRDFLLLHEFGHSFAGLADEYYDATVSYNDFYAPGLEPTPPNITALLDPKQLKWKDLATKGIKVPTPWDKEKHDKMNNEEKRSHRLKKEYRGKVGAFEGAGYASKGMYRPMADCLMFSSNVQPYCKVCEAAINRVIDHYTR
ncbi:MAG: peptidase M64 [bacterium]|nr:peptidase M64 [bacterium]